MTKIVAAATAACVALAWAGASAAVTLPNANPVPCLFGANGGASLCSAVGIRNYQLPVAGVFSRAAPLNIEATVAPPTSPAPGVTKAAFALPTIPAAASSVVETSDVIEAPSIVRSAPVPLPAAAWALLLGLVTLASVGRRT